VQWWLEMLCSGASRSTPDLIPVSAGAGSSPLRRHNSLRAHNSNSPTPATAAAAAALSESAT